MGKNNSFLRALRYLVYLLLFDIVYFFLLTPRPSLIEINTYDTLLGGNYVWVVDIKVYNRSTFGGYVTLLSKTELEGKEVGACRITFLPGRETKEVKMILDVSFLETLVSSLLDQNQRVNVIAFPLDLIGTGLYFVNKNLACKYAIFLSHLFS